MLVPNPKDEIIDPARIKALIPKKPEEMGMGSLGAWADWLRRQPAVRIKRGDNSRSNQPE